MEPTAASSRMRFGGLLQWLANFDVTVQIWSNGTQTNTDESGWISFSPRLSAAIRVQCRKLSTVML